MSIDQLVEQYTKNYTPFQIGYDVGKKGGSSKQNPYERGTFKYKNWIKGFDAGHSDFVNTEN